MDSEIAWVILKFMFPYAEISSCLIILGQFPWIRTQIGDYYANEGLCFFLRIYFQKIRKWLKLNRIESMKKIGKDVLLAEVYGSAWSYGAL